eukprot:CAMPEP_0115325644 /NCGR_PEP_ID=MMETSP0270-20121206/83125_1 /TAXON_ID=71861 /ORGANISM="Scrippsiella trochoidea, Strain CCMP3099" /LENGTH=126 /DNA_ID=CAMNT_0002745849 /DNA_START=369 /DNA_END=746 /DNA_ORIENTATION=-
MSFKDVMQPKRQCCLDVKLICVGYHVAVVGTPTCGLAWIALVSWQMPFSTRPHSPAEAYILWAMMNQATILLTGAKQIPQRTRAMVPIWPANAALEGCVMRGPVPAQLEEPFLKDMPRLQNYALHW